MTITRFQTKYWNGNTWQLDSGTVYGVENEFTTGGGSNAVGYYGVFTANADQTIGDSTATLVLFDTTESSSGVSLGSPLSRVVVANAGVYNFQFSAQLRHSSGGNETVSIWFRINGVDVPRSNTEFDIVGNNAGYVAAWNFVAELTANDYFEIVMSATDSDVRIDYLAAQTSPTRPSTPAVILTVSEVVHVPQAQIGIGIANLDGGHPNTNYGGIAAIDCGGVI
jgi:hypothetical protein